MRTKLQTFLQFIHGYLAVLGVIAVLSCAIFRESGLGYFLHGTLILIPFAATYLGEKYLRGLVSYVLLSLACTVLMFFLGMHIFESLYLTAAAAIIALMRIPSRLHDEAGLFDVPLAGFIAYFVILFFFGMALKNSDIQNIEYWLTFAYIIILLIYSNLKSLNSYLYTRRDTANLPGKQIAATNMLMTSLMYGLLILAMLLIPLLSSDSMLSAIGNAIKSFFRWLSGLFPEQAAQELETVAEQVQESAGFGEFAEAESAPAWLEALYNFLFYTISIIVGIGVCALIIAGLAKLMKLFYRPSLSRTDVEEVLDSSSDQEAVFDDFSGKKSRGLMQLFDPNMQIRRTFKKAIKKGSASRYRNAKPIIPSQLTPTELEDYAGLSDSAENRLLHEYYEKARYSKGGCDREDAARLKRGLS